MRSKTVATRTSNLDANERIGVVYTPSQWSSWAIQHYDLVNSWVSGSSVVDPTVGDGSFIRSLIAATVKSGAQITNEMIRNLFGFDLRSEGIEDLKSFLLKSYGLKVLDSNFRQFDAVLDEFPQKFDFVIGNPPWANFTELPNDYKEILKPKYAEYGLLSNTHSTLLGNSRVDIAALVVSRLVSDALEATGKLLMFLPTSLFDGVAHEPFRNFNTKGKQYYLNSLFDFGNQGIFGESAVHGTNFAFASFSWTANSTEFVQEYKLSDGSWVEQIKRHLPSIPIDHRIREEGLIQIPKRSKPRQGLNTCGANGIFFGDVVEGSLQDEVVLFKNLEGETFQVETFIIYPLLMRDNLTKGIEEPLRYVLLPYDRNTAKPLSERELSRYPQAFSYFESKREILLNRKGTLIQSAMNNTSPWALLGVGEYSFAPFKLLWLTAGQATFEPKIISTLGSKPWQANQSLQAFMAFQSQGEAARISESLATALDEIGLKALGTPKSLSWAQPGRVSRLLSVLK